VGDAVIANLLAAGAPVSACGRAYNVARGERTTVNELAARVRELAGGLPPGHEPPRPGDVRHSQADTSAAEAALGFRAAVGLREGLERTWQSR
jgi:nucleoside-diphosphate-sugar epimerase